MISDPFNIYIMISELIPILAYGQRITKSSITILVYGINSIINPINRQFIVCCLDPSPT